MDKITNELRRYGLEKFDNVEMTRFVTNDGPKYVLPVVRELLTDDDHEKYMLLRMDGVEFKNHATIITILYAKDSDIDIHGDEYMSDTSRRFSMSPYLKYICTAAWLKSNVKMALCRSARLYVDAVRGYMFDALEYYDSITAPLIRACDDYQQKYTLRRSIPVDMVNKKEREILTAAEAILILRVYTTRSSAKYSFVLRHEFVDLLGELDALYISRMAIVTQMPSFLKIDKLGVEGLDEIGRLLGIAVVGTRFGDVLTNGIGCLSNKEYLIEFA